MLLIVDRFLISRPTSNLHAIYNLQTCMKELLVVRVGYIHAHVILEIQEVFSWAPWSGWSLDLNSMNEERTRVCCARNCTGKSVIARPLKAAKGE